MLMGACNPMLCPFHLFTLTLTHPPTLLQSDAVPVSPLHSHTHSPTHLQSNAVPVSPLHPLQVAEGSAFAWYSSPKLQGFLDHTKEQWDADDAEEDAAPAAGGDDDDEV